MNSPGKHGTVFCTSTGERLGHTEPLSHRTTTVRPVPDKTTLTGCVSGEEQRNHPLLPHILVQLDVPVADGEKELIDTMMKGEGTGSTATLCQQERGHYNYQFLWMLGGSFVKKTLTFPLLYYICVFKRINSSVIHESPPSTQVFHSQWGLCEHTKVPAVTASTLQEAGSGSSTLSQAALPRKHVPYAKDMP